jgi:hypothetical protein
MLRKLMLVPIVGAIALLLLAGPASAAPKVPKGTSFAISDTQFCGFLVTLVGVSGQVVRTTLPDGTTILTGPAVVTIEGNDRSLTFNISGPIFTSTTGDVILTGPSIILLEDRGPSFPEPGILATLGRGTIEGGVFDINTFTGTTSDVCEQLGEE